MADTTEAQTELSREEFAAYLRDLADEFEDAGAVRVGVDNKTVTLGPPDRFETEVSVSERSSMLGGTTERLRVDASWSPVEYDYEADADANADDDGDGDVDRVDSADADRNADPEAEADANADASGDGVDRRADEREGDR